MSEENKEVKKVVPPVEAAGETDELTDEEKEAKAKASAEKRAKALAARAARAGGAAKAAASDEPKPPSPNQPILDEAVQLIQSKISKDAVDEAFINEMNEHMPTLVIKDEYWKETARFLHDDEHFQLRFLRNVSGVDEEKHMEVVYYLVSLETKKKFCFKVKTDREQPSVQSVTPIWATANWNEREIYDLLGIDFPGHPDLRRIMLSDDWIGHPLRKDYVPFDPEV